MSLTAPGAGSTVYADTAAVLSAGVGGGTAPYTNVVFYTNFNNTGWAVAGTSSGSTPSVNLGQLPVGSYQFYAVATDSTPATTNSVTNSFTVMLRPLAVALSAPANGASFVRGSSVSATGAVTGGTSPYSTKFMVSSDGGAHWTTNAAGAGAGPVWDYGVLAQGNYLLYAQTTDSAGSPATVNSLTNSFAVVGPILVGAGGASMDFSVKPPVQSWSTRSVPGGAAGDSETDLDNCMSTNNANQIATVLGTQAGSGTSGNAYWRSGDLKLGTQPTGNGVTLLMATLENSAGGEITALRVSYTFAEASTNAGDTIKGQRSILEFEWGQRRLEPDWECDIGDQWEFERGV